jgi:AAA domain (dynein-related subfamily)
MFTWTPFYKELAKVLLGFRNRQPELVQILTDIKDKTDIPIIRLVDAPQPATAPTLSVIDPFTFFATFNRGLKDQNRIGIITIIKEKLHLQSEIPNDFNGIPVVDNMQSWFFPYAFNRKADDISSLWDLAESIISNPPEQLNPELFNRCLEVHTVGPAKLTMGMFWMNPDNYLALDEKNTKAFENAGIDIEVVDHASYLKLLAKVREKLGTNYPAISIGAWQNAKNKNDSNLKAENKETAEPGSNISKDRPEAEGLGQPSELNFWKIAPGDKGWQWEECRENNFIAVGWDDFGDLSGIDRDEFDKRFAKLHESNPDLNKAGCEQLWKFSKIKRRDRIVANRGTSEVLGIGTVTGPYYFTPDVEFGHRLPVRWDDVRLRKVEKGGWKRTLISLSEADFNEIVNAVPVDTLENSATNDAGARNIILYGPPGTGKTFKLRGEYMDKFTDHQSILSEEERAAALVKDLSWWEVVALALLDTKEKRGSVAQILAHPLVEARIKLSSNNNPRAMIWAALQNHTKEECQNVKYTSRSQPLIFEKDNESVWSVDAGLVETILPGLKLTVNEYHHPAENGKIEQKRFEFVTFHQSFSYEDFIEGIKPEITETETAATSGQICYRVEPGIFKKLCRQALANPGKKFAILIDEINRGNVASIFGELITLIEEDKRLKGPNELTTKLPYSREEFGVPNNLYIIGTMNTADRSVEALDTALRRRFTFIEMRPDLEKVTQPDGLKVDLRKIFEIINARIERLHDADHCIGHAYFMGVKDLAGLRSIFANKIIPLLREYFYGNPAKVGMVLGERFVKRKNDSAQFATGSWGLDELDQKEVFTFVDPSDFSEEDFQTIYAKNGAGI